MCVTNYLYAKNKSICKALRCLMNRKMKNKPNNKQEIKNGY